MLAQDQDDQNAVREMHLLESDTLGTAEDPTDAEKNKQNDSQLSGGMTNENC